MKKLYIISEKVRDRTPFQDGAILTERDFDPTKPFFAEHTDIEPESIGYIYTKGIFEHTPLIHYILRIVDWLLAVNGTLEISFFHTRLDGCGAYVCPEDYLAYSVSMAFKERIRLTAKSPQEVGKATLRTYIKVRAALCRNDDIGSWTFGIVSDGRKNERIMKIGETIKQLNIPRFEVLICGPAPSTILPEYMKVLDDSDFYGDTRIPLCRKKNAIISNAAFCNLVIIHDRINFDEKWYEQIKSTRNYFDAIVPAIFDEGTKTKHVIDFDTIKPPLVKFRWPKFKNRWTPHIYMDGSIMIIKTSIAREFLLRPYLHWGEREDVDFSRRISESGYVINVFHNIVVTTMTYAKRGRRDLTYLQKLVATILALPRYVKWYTKERRQFFDYLK